MITVYSYDSSSKISAHFNSNEFRCKCGKPHEFKIDSNLIDKLEELYSALNCSKIVISSGFRCEAHDKAVGGNGNGQHTKGTAADACCYGQDGNPISSKIVCCKAQDIGLTGIANINTSYTYTHLDVRSGGKWYGNEIKGNNTVTNDFYTYFGIAKEGSNVPVKNGIDISWCQTQVDWSKVKTDFAIIQAGGGRVKNKKDDMFESHYAGAKSAGIPVGAYWFSRALTVDEAVTEADTFISILKGKQFEYPVYMDVEIQKQLDLGKDKLSEIIKAFIERVERAGYWTGLYVSRAHLQTYVNDYIKNRFALWVAEWGTKLNYTGSVGMWQRSESGTVNGIVGNVDLDVAYVDYPSQIKAKGLNGFGVSAQEQQEPQPSTPDTSTPDTTNNGGYKTDDKNSANEIEVEVVIGDRRYSGKLNLTE